MGIRVPATRPTGLQTGAVAEALGVSREYVTRLIGCGRIVASTTPGGHYRVTRDELERILEQGLRDACAQR